MESIRDKDGQSSRVEARQSLYRLWFACPVMYAIYSIQCCHLSLTWQLVNALEAHFLRLHVRVMSWGKCARFASNCITPHTHYALRIRTLGQGRKCLLKASLHASKRSRRNRKSMCGWPEPGQRSTRPDQTRPDLAGESESVTRWRHRIAMAHTHFRFLLLNYVIIERNAIKRR